MRPKRILERADDGDRNFVCACFHVLRDLQLPRRLIDYARVSVVHPDPGDAAVPLRQSDRIIAGRLLELGIIDQLPRKIRLTKILGKTNGEFPVGIEKIGWEMNLPKVGERYCLYLDDGRVFRTGEVAECRVDHFRTGSSVYRVEVLEESPAALAGAGGKSVAPEGTDFSSE